MARMVGMHVAACGSMKHHLDVEICFFSDYYSEKGNEISRKASIVVDFRSVVLCWGATHHLSNTSCSTQRSTWEVMIASDDWSSDSAQQVIVQLSVLWHEFFMLRTVLRGGSVHRLYISSLITHDVQTSPSHVKSPNYFLSLGTTCSILELWCR